MSAPAASRPRLLLPALVAAAAAVAGLWALAAASRSYAWSGPVSQEPYTLLVDGFRSGHTWLAKDAPPQLARAPNPYLFAAYRPFLGPPWSLIDLSYFRGHLYAYFGVTPAVVLFWPYRVLTGHELRQAHAVLVFCVAGYAASLALALAAWRRHFPEAGPWAGAALALLLGSASTLPVFVVRPGVYEVSIACGYAFSMLSLGALWRSWHGARGRAAWLAAASLLYGLAVGSRPSLLFGAVVLFLPAWALVRRGERAGAWGGAFLAAFVPIAAVGLGLAAYNRARFGDALQFGHDYQLSGNDVYGTASFSPRFLWSNFRLYFLAPPRWHGGFPYVWGPASPPLPRGHLPIEFFFGLLPAFPVLLAALLAFARRAARPAALAGALLGGAAAATICAYAGATSRYLLDFAPALALVAGVGLLAAASGSLAVGRPVAVLLRATLALALLLSVATGWLLALALSAFYRGAEQGTAQLAGGKTIEALRTFSEVCRINPDFRGQADLAVGNALLAQGNPRQAVGYLMAAAAEVPAPATACFNLGQAWIKLGQPRPAAAAYARAAQLDPHDPEAEADLGVALARLGDLRGAIEHERAALRIDPGFEQAGRNLKVLEKVEAARRR